MVKSQGTEDAIFHCPFVTQIVDGGPVDVKTGSFDTGRGAAGGLYGIDCGSRRGHIPFVGLRWVHMHR